MPKRSSSKEQEVLGQIFDFIFKQAKQKPGKTKPIKPTGLNGKDMLTDGLVAALERPGVFLTEQAIKDFNDSLDLTFLKLKPDQAGPMSVKVSSNTLIDIFKDPMKFMQGTIDKAKPARLEAKATFIGPIMRQFVSNAWARKYADLDTQQAVRLGLATQIADPRKKKLEIERDKWNMQSALGASSSGRGQTFGESKGEQLTYMQERASTLIARATFGEREWNTMDNDDREDILKIFALGEKSDANDYKSELQSILAAKGYNQAQQNTLADRFADTMTRNKAIDGAPGENGVSLSNANFYRNLEISNLDNRIIDLQRGGHGLSVDETNRQIESFQKAKTLIAAQDLDAGRVNAANAQLRSWIQQTKNDIRTETDPNRKAQLKSKLRELRGDSRQLDTISFWGTVGTFEGYWGSLNHLVGEGAFVTDILNGDLFDSNKTDALRPSEGTKSDLGIVFFVPRTDGKNQLINNYNKALTQVYYFTPKSIMRTIFLNGEGFAYSMFKSKGLVNSLTGANGVTAAQWTQLLAGDPQTVISSILSSPGLQGLQGMQKLQLELSLKNYARMGKLHDIFSRNQRIKDAITKGIEKLLTKARAKMIKGFMSNALFKKMFSGSAGKLLGQWIAKGGIQNIARALVVGIANAFGLATSGGLANIVISAAAMVVVDVLFAVGKILFGIVIFALIGFFGLMVMGGIGLNNFAKKTYTYANTVPGEVVSNPNFKGTSPITGEEDDSMADFIGGTLPDGQKCLLGSGSLHCSQGAFGSYSHQNVAAIDLSSGANDFYAPQFCGNNNCVVTFSGQTTCTAGSAGGMVIFTAAYGGTTYEFKLIHVKAAIGIGVGTQLGAGQQVAKVMPWGPETSACSSGTHIHLQTKANGVAVDPWQVMTVSASQGGFACSISVCDP